MILESEGICEAAKNKAEGEKSARILPSEAQMQDQVNKSIFLPKIFLNFKNWKFMKMIDFFTNSPKNKTGI